MRAILMVILIPGLVPGCTKNTDPTTVAFWMDQLGESETRSNAIRELGNLGKPEATVEVLKWLEREGEWQPDAAYALGQLGDASVVPRLVAAIDYSVGTGRDKVTRRKNRTNLNIARALAMLKDPRAVEPLVRLLRTPEPKTREGVLQSLGSLGSEAAVAPVAALAETDPEPFLRKVAVQALGEMGSGKGVPTLIKMLYVEVPGISFYNEARRSLLQVGKAATPMLMETLLRKNDAVEAIRQPNGSPLAEGAVEAKVGYVLGNLGVAEAREPMLAALNRLFARFEQREQQPVYASVPGAIIELCYALTGVGSREVVQTLEKVATTADPQVRKAAAEALTILGDRRATRTLLSVAHRGPEAARRAAVRAVSRLAPGTELPRFDALAGAGGVEKASPGSMAEMVGQERARLVAAQECGEDAACWTGKLAAGDPRARERAAYELGWLGAGDKVDDLLKAAEDDDANVRMAAVFSMRRLDGVDVEKLQTIHDAWDKKIEYVGVNQELERLIARKRAEQ